MGYITGATVIVVSFVGLTLASLFVEKRLSMKTRHSIATGGLICCILGILAAVVLTVVAKLLSPGTASTIVRTLATIAGAVAGLGAVGHMVFYLPHYSRRIFHAREHVDREIHTEISDAGIEKIIRVADTTDKAIALETKDQLLGRLTALRHILRYSYRHGFVSKTAVDILADASIEEVVNRTTSEDESRNQFLTAYVDEMKTQRHDLRK